MPDRPRTIVVISLASALVLCACTTTEHPEDGSDTGDPTGLTDPSTASPTATTVDPTGSEPTSTDPTASDSATDSTTTTASDPTATQTDPTGDTTTGGAGLACPLSDEPGAQRLALTPALFSAGADPSNAPVCDILNPERGLHRFLDLRGLDDDTLDGATADGMTVIYGRVLLSEYREVALDDAVLTEISAGFDLVRAHGMKVVPRFHYSDAGDEPDAELARILGHIDQLAPLLQAHADVILTLQAGFIGAWGEWHSSQNGLDAPGPRKQILDALLAALPEHRTVSVRRPSFKKDAYGGPLTADTAHDGSPLARVGHVNDCFLASDSDFGTYQEDGEKDYAIADSQFVPTGGETCAVNPPRSSCPSAKDELALHHWTHLNAGYHPDVLAGWQEDGCYREIACRLGYRLAVTDLRWAASAAPGGSLPIELALVNDGYAAPVNARTPSVVLDGPIRLEVPVDGFDLRTVLPGDPHTLCVDAPLPADLPPGDYRIGLRLADAAPTLADDPRQAIRLANDADVEWSDGINWFTATVSVP